MEAGDWPSSPSRSLDLFCSVAASVLGWWCSSPLSEADVIYRARERATGKIVALKKTRLPEDDEGVPPTLREVSLLRMLSVDPRERGATGKIVALKNTLREAEETSPDLLKNTPLNIVGLEDVIDHSLQSSSQVSSADEEPFGWGGRPVVLL